MTITGLLIAFYISYAFAAYIVYNYGGKKV